MDILIDISTFALKQMLDGTKAACVVVPGGDAVKAVAGFLENHFRAHSNRLTRALTRSNERAWRTLEIALAGTSFWDRCKALVASGDQTKFRNEMQQYLNDMTLPAGEDPEKFRRFCLSELKAARKAGLLDRAELNPAVLAEAVGRFVGFTQPDEVLAAETQLLQRVADTLGKHKYENLGRLITSQPRPAPCLLAGAFQYYFRRAVEEDPKLFQGLAFAKLEQIQQSQTDGLVTIQALVTSQGEKLEEMLGDLQADVFATYNSVLDVREE